MGEGYILAIETSCDETAVAVATLDGEILVSKVASQVALHAPHGGVVPELASRNHSVDLPPLVNITLEKAGVTWDQLRIVSATSGPGLASSLLVGDTTAKSVSVALNCPFYSINHMEGHLLSPFIGLKQSIPEHVALVVSGGHTMLVHVVRVNDYEMMGSTKDDAAGEAFDKVGKMLGLTYPAGPEIARLAKGGSREAFQFPRSMIDRDGHEFSFSGMKTSVLYQLKNLENPLGARQLSDLCASFEEAIVDVLVSKLFNAAEERGVSAIAISGGVSCNERLRTRVEAEAARKEMRAFLPATQYTTDNAAMIAFAAAMRAREGVAPSELDLDIDPNLSIEGPVTRLTEG